MTTEDILREVAALEVPDPRCLHRDGEPHESCPCNCAGCMVPVVPGLRVQCKLVHHQLAPDMAAYSHPEDNKRCLSTRVSCDKVGCSGWTVETDLGRVLTAIREAGGDYEIRSRDDGDFVLVWIGGDEEAGVTPSDKGLRDLAAVAVALREATR